MRMLPVLGSTAAIPSAESIFCIHIILFVTSDKTWINRPFMLIDENYYLCGKFFLNVK